jgi:hypothetical protein
MGDKMRVIRLIALLGLLAVACDFGTGAEGELTGWDWALALSREAVDMAFGEHWYVKAFGAEYLDITGDLYSDMDDPEWDVYYSDGSEACLQVLIHPDGQYTILEFNNYFNNNLPLTSTYDSDAVTSWLRTASNLYRELTGLEDDACYGLDCDFDEDDYDCDYVRVYLYDADLELLAWVGLLPQTDEILRVYF